MKRFVVLSAATITALIPFASAAPAGASVSPAEYRPECEQGYQALKAFWDAVLPPGKAVFGPMEKGVCGEQKHTPTN